MNGGVGRRRSRRQVLRWAGAASALAVSTAVFPTRVSAQSATRPLLLIHGFGDRREIWGRSDNAVVAHLLRAGYRRDQLQSFAYPELPGVPDSEDSQGDISVAGSSAASVIRELARQSGDGQVDVLGFSMGGLVARWAINALRDGSGGQPLVQRAIFLASPHAGADILMWFARLSERAQSSLVEVARDVAGIDLTRSGARQMLPESEFLRELNEPTRADDRVHYAVVAGSVEVRLQLGQWSSTLDVGDGVMSVNSASTLPALHTSRHVMRDVVSTAGEAPWAAIRRSPLFHPRLLFNDDVGLAVAAELMPRAGSLRDQLAVRLERNALVRGLG